MRLLPYNWIGAYDFSDPTPGISYAYKWMDAVYPYTKNEQLFTCPSDSSNRKTYTYFQKLTPAMIQEGKQSNNPKYFGSYCTNVAYWDSGPGQSPSSDVSSKQTVRLAQLARPSETVWVTEGNGSYQCAWANIGQQPTISAFRNPRTLGLNGGDDKREGAMVERHQGHIDVIWCDTHAKASDLNTLTQKATSGPTFNAYRYFTIEDD